MLWSTAVLLWGPVAACAQVFELHHVTVNVSVSTASFRVTRRGVTVLESLPNDAFLRIGSGYLNLNSTIWNGALYEQPAVPGWVSAPESNAIATVAGPARPLGDEANVTIEGSVVHPITSQRVPYVFTLMSRAAVRNLRFVATVAVEGEEDGSYVSVRFGSPASDTILGFGMQYSRWNLKNLSFPLILSEQGIGRGLEPVTEVLNTRLGGRQGPRPSPFFFSPGETPTQVRAGGDWHTTYSATAAFVTRSGRGLILDQTHVGVADLGAARGTAVELSLFHAATISGAVLVADDPGGPRRLRELVGALTNETGRMQPLPAWVDRGAILGAEGGGARVRAIVAKVAAFGVPLAGVWLQDWSGLVNYTASQRVLWNWELDERWYPDWNETTATWRRDHGARVLAYVNPYFTNASRFRHRVNYFDAGVDRGYFVKRQDGAPYLIHSGDIDFAMVDLTNPAAFDWMVGVIRANVVDFAGASGWMHDFGEYLPLDAVLHDGSDPVEYHDRYALDWARVGRAAAGADVDDLVWFDRSATAGSPGAARLFWMGDQMHTLDGFDGAKSALNALLQSGLSGVSLGHSDVGGYTTVDVPLARYPRTPTVLMRWTELSAFSDAILRTHPGSKPSDNVQVWTNATFGFHFAKFARVFACLAPFFSPASFFFFWSGDGAWRHPF